MREFHTYGSPGTGKTTDLTKQIERARDKRGYTPAEIMVTSFTKAGAEEVASREPMVEDKNIGTLHSLARSLMEERRPVAKDKVKDFNLWIEATDHHRHRLTEAVVTSNGAPRSRADRHYRDYMLCRAKMVEPEDEHLAAFGEVWEEWKREADVVDFTDMLENALKSGRRPEGVRIIFGDEAQDFDRLQITLLRQWARDIDTLVLCGDDDQCIYEWNGASVENLLGVKPYHSRVLNHSWRLGRPIWDKAKTFIEENVKRRVPKDWSPRGDDGFMYYLDEDFRYAEEIVDIAQKHAEGGQTVMILQSCDYMLKQIIFFLRKKGIPFHNPYKKDQGAWNPLKFGTGGSAHRMWCFLRGFADDQRTEHGPAWTGGQLAMWMPLISAKLLRPGVKKKQVIEHVNNTGGVMYDTEWRVWFRGDPFYGYTMPRAPSWLYENALDTKRRAIKFPQLIAEKQGYTALGPTVRPNIIIGTIHSVKGGQADIVILSPDTSQEAHLARSEGVHKEEEQARLFYVGMTRAKQGLYIARPRPPCRRGLPSFFCPGVWKI